MGIKVIVFDYGQVISLPQDPCALDKIAAKANVDRKQFEHVLWSLRGQYDRGVISARDYYRKVLANLDASVDDKTMDEMIEMDYNSWKYINNETVELMENVKKAGYTLGILSNMPHDFLTWARINIPVFSLPQIGVFSCEVNLIKPEEAIYRKLLSLAGVKAEELVFFDDIPENVNSAKNLGIKAFLWKDPKSARQELLSLGVNLDGYN
ncbi:MAG: HAD family phosphatase [Treponema sp.]|nr:HAD family phosphatase [Treponema sp.]